MIFMENAEIKMSEKESLELITSMINKARNRVGETGVLYLMWGWLILVCCFVNFITAYYFNYPYGYFIWFSTWILLVYQIFYIRKKRKKSTVKTYTREINAAVWIVFFICMMLVFFIANYLKKYEIINPLLLVLYGMPTFLSGVILKFRPLLIGGICCWALSVLSVFISPDVQLLFIATAVIAAWIIPGYLLKKNFMKEKTNGF